MNLFQLGNFVLSSGAESKWKLECDALTDEDWKALAEMVYQRVGSFQTVEGVPTGGLKLAKALKPYAGLAGPHLIVDDVLTTGSSLERQRETWLNSEPREFPLTDLYMNVRGVVVFARGQCPSWVKAVFQIHQSLWLKP